MMIDLAELVRVTRTNLGLSQQKLADMAGVSQTTIDKIEKGLIKRSRFAYKIASVMGIAPEILQEILATGLPGFSKQIDSISPIYVDRVPLRSGDTSFIEEDASALMSVEAESEADLPDLFFIDEHPLAHIAPPDFVKGIAGAFAFIVPNNLMAPCISEGDTVFIHPLLPSLSGSICLFGLTNQLDNIGRHLIAVLTGQDKRAWRATVLSKRQNLILPKAKWATAQRVVATHYRL